MEGEGKREEGDGRWDQMGGGRREAGDGRRETGGRGHLSEASELRLPSKERVPEPLELLLLLLLLLLLPSFA